MTEQLGERYEIARNYFKKHACCRYNHASLDALLTIIGRCPTGRLDPSNIREIQVNTYSLAAQLCDPSPRNMLAGKFSIPFALATTIVHNHTGQESFSPTAIENPVVQELARRVQVVEEPTLTAMMPAYRPAEVRVTFTDGSVEMAKALVNKGDAEDPYSPADLQHKYFSLAGPVWGDRTSTAVYEIIERLEELSDITSLTDLLQCDKTGG
jgi:2-methylcitrate dehydratase PrpD